MRRAERHKRFSGAALAVTAAVVVLLVSGCAGQIKQRNFDARESYHAPGLTNPFKVEGIALLTATGGENGVEYRKLLGDIVEQTIREKRPDIRIIPYWRSLSIINMDGLTGEYALMLKDYEQTGILNKVVLKKLGHAIGVKYFLQPRLVNFQQNESTRFSFLGLTMIKTHESKVKVYLELWNAETGEILWIGTGEANMATEHYRAKPIPFEKVAALVVEKIVDKMP